MGVVKKLMHPDLLTLLAPVSDALWRCMVTHVCQLYNAAKGSARLVVFRGAEVVRVKVKVVSGRLQCSYKGRLTPLAKCVLACVDAGCCRHGGCGLGMPAPVVSAAATLDYVAWGVLMTNRKFTAVQHMLMDMLIAVPLVSNGLELLCELLFPFHWMSNSTVVRAAQVAHVLRGPKCMAWVKQFINDWSAVVRDYICPACALRGISVLTQGTCVAPKHKGQTAFLSAHCNACPASSVVCVSTPRLPGTSAEWWMTTPWSLRVRRTSCSRRWTKSWPRVAAAPPSQTARAQVCC